MGVAAGDGAGGLLPYVPRLTADWLRTDPDRRHRTVVGTLAFVDISGFTRLTERLARRGKVGAEEMSETLRATFIALLGVANEDGADLLKWGGDAVLLLFQGEQHAQRAARATRRMQQTINRVGRLRTTAGPVRLRMSVGVHSGRFDLFLVGDPEIHRELLLAGADVSTTVAMESIADAGQVALSPATAGLLDGSCLGPTKGDAVLLAREPAMLPSQRDAEDDNVSGGAGHDQLDVSIALPIAIRAHLQALAGAPGDPEHRPVTVAFVKYVGTDSLLAEHGAGALTDALDEAVRTVQHATSANDVTFFETDLDADGFKVMLTAGAPRTAGNDEERMLRTARQVVETPTRLAAKVGVNRGHVFAGDFGPDFRRTYSVKGDAINLAARVMGKSTPRGVLATRGVVDASRTLFATTALDPFTVKGKTALVHALQVGPMVGSRQLEGELTLLVGRDDEVALLDAALEQARAGRGSLVQIVAEPGLGKSRLAAELVERATDVRVLRVECDEYGAETPYAAVRPLLRAAFGIATGSPPAEAAHRLRGHVVATAPELEPWLPLVAAAAGVDVPSTPEVDDLDEQFRRPRLEETTVTLLHRGLPSTALVVVDDAHEMDEASADLLRRVARVIDDRPWLLLVLRRDQPTGLDPTGLPGVRTIDLAPLSEGAAMSLAEVVTEEAPLPPQALAALAGRAGGNPLFLRELLGAAGSRGVDALDQLPDSVEALVASQIDRLGHADRSVLRHAAVLGAVVDKAVLLEMLGDGEADEAVAALRRLHAYLVPDGPGVLRFRHGLVRDVAYEGLPFKRRRELHAQAGDIIEAATAEPETRAELLSLHFAWAGRHEKAWRYALVAGDRARSRYAHAEAADLLARAVAAGRACAAPAAELSAALETLGDVRSLLGSSRGAATAYREARQPVRDDPLRQAQLLLKEALIDHRLGRYPHALRRLSRGMRLLDADSTQVGVATRSVLATRYAFSLLSQGRYAAARRWGNRAIADAEAAMDLPAMARAHLAMHLVLLYARGDDELPHGEWALSIYTELGDLSGQAHCLNNLALRAIFEGRWTEAVDMFGRAAGGFRRIGDSANEANSVYNLADMMVRQGRLAAAEPLLHEALRVARAVGDEELVALVLRESGRAAARSGRIDEAMALLTQARDRLTELGEPHEAVDAEAAIAEGLLVAGRPAEALGLADHALARATTLGASTLVPTLARVRGLAQLAIDDVDAAAAAMDGGLLASAEPDARHEQAFLLAARAAVARRAGDPDAADYERRGADLLARLGVVALPVPVEGADRRLIDLADEDPVAAESVG